MLKLKFDSKLDFQIDAINSVVDLFKGQIKRPFSYTFQVIPNLLDLTKEKILANLQEIQQRNGLDLSKNEDLEEPYNFTIEMETGTGKTYVYLRTILELNKKYGFTKFIIVVPSVAIKEGVLKNLDITRDHFKELCDNIPYTYFPYSSNKLVQIRMFAQDTNLQIMVITKDAFNKDINIIHNTHDKMGDKPIEIIKKTNPIVILDEPQKMGGEATQWGLTELNSLFILRYSATHKEIYNLLYKLTPFDAYSLGLVKKIEVLSITEEGDPGSKKIILEKIESLSSGLKAKVKAFVKEKEGIKFKTITIKHGDDLAKKTDNAYYEGFIVNEINKGANYISFSNGVKIYEGKSSIEEDEIVRIMIRETINEHLEKKRKLNTKGIKVLSLFFLNRVDDYLRDDGYVRRIFKEEFGQLAQSGYREFSSLEFEKIHSGYFSKMKKEKSIEEDESVYDLIMKDKERLLSLDEPVEFIFSHSALREGWDNPNVFNICTLAYSTSEIKKRQEIGRGLRLPVNLYGDRIQSKDINLLTVITNESYKDYVEKLQTEFRDEVGEEAPPIEDKGKRVEIKIKEDALNSSMFKNLWAKVSKKAKFSVNIDSEKFCDECVKEINNIDLKSPEISIQKILLETIKKEEVEDKKRGVTYEEVKIKTEFLKESSEEVKKSKIFNIVKFIEDETHLTRNAIFKILSKINNLHLLFENPYSYGERVVDIMLWKLKEYEVENIGYYELDESFDLDIFNKEIQTYDKYVVKVNKSIYDSVIRDSDIEREFAVALDADSRVKLFVKLPEQYKIETPAGDYTPDWLVIVEKISNGTKKEEIYFVVETKGTDNLHELRPDEQIKINSGAKRFTIIKGATLKYVAPVKDYDGFVDKW